jgi:Zn-dependent peptidase ImmA (M78 family)
MKAKAEKRAEALLAEFNITEPPVPVETIAEKMGAILVFEPFEGKEDDISGILYRKGDNTIIGINSAHSETRRRFSIAHELGHLALHRKELFVDKVVRIDFRDRTSSLAIKAEEIAANAFAAGLLMPRDFLAREILRKLSKRSSQPAKEKLINHLAKTFKVSPQAMEYRLINLGILESQ